MLIISPSVLASEFSRLAEDVAKVEKAGFGIKPYVDDKKRREEAARKEEQERKALANYEGKQIVLGFRPENTREGDQFALKVTANENLGMNTLVHGHIGQNG